VSGVTAALLILHVQEGIVAMCGEAGAAVVEPIRKAIVTARAHGVRVIHVRLEYRPGAPEANPRTRGNRFTQEYQEGMPAARIPEALRPEGDDLVLVNKRASAFNGNDLQVLLRSLGVRRLVLTGLGTSGVVLATFIAAADLDYEVTVLSDGCGDPKGELHSMLLEHIFSLRAEVLTVAEWTGALGQAAPG
jgi:nicotinamidase-related amidase